MRKTLTLPSVLLLVLLGMLSSGQQGCFGDLPPDQPELALTISGSGTVLVLPPNQVYSATNTPVTLRWALGDSCTLTANPDLGWRFDHWEGDLTGTLNPGSLLMEEVKRMNVTAVFASTNTDPTKGALQGIVYAPNGITPLAGAVLSVPDLVPSNPPLSSTSSGPDGSFVLGNVPPGTQIVTILKGAWNTSFSINVVAGQTSPCPVTLTSLPVRGPGAPKVAVVTGIWDRMEDVLAKLGMGAVDDAGYLVNGSEAFDLYGGSSPLTAYDLFPEPARMAQYDIIFIDCGANDTVLSLLPSTLQNIRDYVNNGGKLFVTDRAYGYVEQAFPAAIDFEASDLTAADRPEDEGAANVGADDITCDATVLDSSLRAWLQARGALNPNLTVHIAGFVYAWTMIETAPSTTRVWIEGPVSTAMDPSIFTVRPLTATFNYGAGRVLYTSYHTEEEPSTDLRPQERILAYLIFEL